MGLERRKAVRIEKSVMALYSMDAYAKNWDMTTVKDISEIGIRISTNRDFSIGETIMLRIKIPLEPFKWLEIKGKVISSSLVKDTKKERVLFHITQIEFIELKDEDKKLIVKYISWYLNRRA
ncbi:MAG: PilZ domain-containing protein [Candidatus Omnitrophota bacterium]